MSDVKIGIIGHFGGNKVFFDGQTIKTKEINNYFENYYKIKTEKFDTYKNAKNPFKLFFGVKRLFKNCEVIILIVSTRGYKILLPLLMLLNKRFKRKILDFVIGGNRYTILENTFLQKLAKKTDKIYVETINIKNEYEKYKFTNVEVVPNFKNLKLQKIDKFDKKEKLSLCTFSRVCKEKGINDGINLVNICNSILKQDVFYLDIYGQIDPSYKNEFEDLISKCNNTVSYKGMVEFSKSAEILKKYDLLLFLTFWNGEGFPGSIIDAFFSGLPVMATDFKYNFDILKEDKTGIKVEVNNIKMMEEKLLFYYINQEKLYEMKLNCIDEAKKYLPDNVMKNVIKYIDNHNKI